MDPVTIRVICGILAVVLLALIVLRRRQRAQQ
jgi:MYXO-CTERM domain-containing protein